MKFREAKKYRRKLEQKHQQGEVMEWYEDNHWLQTDGQKSGWG